MTKSKSSTIAIVVLSVLLAAALASTIVLAAFSQTKKAETTLTFGGGVKIQVANTTMNESAQWITYQLGSDGARGAAITGSTTSLTTGAQLAAFDVINKSTSDIAIAFQLSTSGGAQLYVSEGTQGNETTALVTDTPNYNASGTEGTGSLDGWVVISSVGDGATAKLVKELNTVYLPASINGLTDNTTVTVTLKIAAVPAGANAEANLAQAITAGSFAVIEGGEVQSQA